jgi:hypothetical protein
MEMELRLPSPVSRPTLNQRLGVELARIRKAQLYRVRRAVDGAHGVDITVDGKRCSHPAGPPTSACCVRCSAAETA